MTAKFKARAVEEQAHRVSLRINVNEAVTK